MDTTFPKIVAASIDGRVHNVRYRQDQFHRLQSAILRDLEEIKHSISQEFSRSAQEVQVEICLALKDNEYLVANGHGNIDRRRGAGIVYILPTRHTLFYSVIAALSAALAAGNCIILELPQTTSLVSSLLRGLLSQTLDGDIFAIADERPEREFLSTMVLVDQQVDLLKQRIFLTWSWHNVGARRTATATVQVSGCILSGSLQEGVKTKFVDKDDIR
ncbi:uncharacterized protein ASPGLDRAFT_34663 [Aspergillus glaucus CBS 516.65]|uniref:Aldehyde dehydrogenase domain-containing protein n=1 Tax=Aspergillus glaucus CBS 516.65 TaxID=1160497 RepID=A0A1L9VMB3_ASPGL|nr:hypothetical protein ASPGLDRAFT_34663 [Aspergillus glaucus CBS 516.65]OJJ85012.1 hypothetical protein ASPGLDRAFT_34663 [Aspergillus glaucus CBS 516.65]